MKFVGCARYAVQVFLCASRPKKTVWWPRTGVFGLPNHLFFARVIEPANEIRSPTTYC